jgi:predicted ATPase
MGTRGEYALYYLYKYGNQPITNTKVLHPDTEEGENILSVQVNYWLSYITPKVQVRAYYDSNLVRGTFQIGDSPEFKPTNVGFGLTYVLPVIIALLTAKEGAMIIIENPESDLHPAAQSKIAELIVRCANSGRQVFIETHSDHIIYGVRVCIKQKEIAPENWIAPEKVKTYYFQRAERSQNAVVDNIVIDKRGRLENAPKGFFDQFRINQGKLL